MLKLQKYNPFMLNKFIKNNKKIFNTSHSSTCHINIDKRDLVKNSDFYEWLTGFIDGEGNFSIFKKENSFKFRFQIKLHCDDRPVLEYIQNRLQIGKVYPTQALINKDINNLRSEI